MRHIHRCMLAAVLGSIFAASPSPTKAHHGAGTLYYVDKSVRLMGTLVRVEWQNPHNWYYVDVKDANGVVVHWGMEGAPPGHLYRDGVKRETILGLVGSTVTVEGHPSRDGSKTLNVQKIILADGTSMPL